MKVHRALRPALLALFLAGSFSSCTFFEYLGATDAWKKVYEDNSQNLIAAKGFSLSEFGIDGAKTNGKWTWAWREEPDAAFDYMNLSNEGAVGSGAPPGLDPAAIAYRLSILNLVTDGDFEGSADVPNSWKADTVGTTISIESAANKIHGIRSLFIELQSNRSARYLLERLSDSPGSSIGHNYSWSFYIGSIGISYKLDNAASEFIPDDFPNRIIQTTADYRILGGLNGISAKEPKAFFLGSSLPESAYIDDIRVARVGMRNALRLLLTRNDTTPSLWTGYYEFSIWVKKPADRLFVSEQAARNPYASSKVFLELNPLKPVSPGTHPVASYDVPASGQWTKLVLRGDEISNISFDLQGPATEPVLEIVIMPTDSQKPEPGEIFIASPSLRLFIYKADYLGG